MREWTGGGVACELLGRASGQTHREHSQWLARSKDQLPSTHLWDCWWGMGASLSAAVFCLGGGGRMEMQACGRLFLNFPFQQLPRWQSWLVSYIPRSPIAGAHLEAVQCLQAYPPATVVPPPATSPVAALDLGLPVQHLLT